MAPLTEAEALCAGCALLAAVPELGTWGNSSPKKVIQGGSWTQGHQGLRDTAPCSRDLATKTGVFGKETSHFPHFVPVSSLLTMGRVGKFSFFFVISPLGWMMDTAGSQG